MELQLIVLAALLGYLLGSLSFARIVGRPDPAHPLDGVVGEPEAIKACHKYSVLPVFACRFFVAGILRGPVVHGYTK